METLTELERKGRAMHIAYGKYRAFAKGYERGTSTKAQYEAARAESDAASRAYQEARRDAGLEYLIVEGA